VEAPGSGAGDQAGSLPAAAAGAAEQARKDWAVAANLAAVAV